MPAGSISPRSELEDQLVEDPAFRPLVPPSTLEPIPLTGVDAVTHEIYRHQDMVELSKKNVLIWHISLATFVFFHAMRVFLVVSVARTLDVDNHSVIAALVFAHYTLVGICSSLLTFWSGVLSFDFVFALQLSGSCIAMWLEAGAQTFVMFAVGFLLSGVCFATPEMGKAYALCHLPRECALTANNHLLVLCCVAALFGPLVAGLLSHFCNSVRAPFFVSAVLCSALALFFVSRVYGCQKRQRAAQRTFANLYWTVAKTDVAESMRVSQSRRSTSSEAQLSAIEFAEVAFELESLRFRDQQFPAATLEAAKAEHGFYDGAEASGHTLADLFATDNAAMLVYALCGVFLTSSVVTLLLWYVEYAHKRYDRGVLCASLQLCCFVAGIVCGLIAGQRTVVRLLVRARHSREVDESKLKRLNAMAVAIHLFFCGAVLCMYLLVLEHVSKANWLWAALPISGIALGFAAAVSEYFVSRDCRSEDAPKLSAVRALALALCVGVCSLLVGALWQRQRHHNWFLRVIDIQLTLAMICCITATLIRCKLGFEPESFRDSSVVEIM